MMPPNHYYAASATDINTKNKTVSCQDSAGSSFDIPYDFLVIATGSQVRPFLALSQDQLPATLHD